MSTFVWWKLLYSLLYISLRPLVSSVVQKTAHLKPSSISTLPGISLSTSSSVTILNDKWSIDVSTQYGSDMHISLDNNWGFHPLYPSSLELYIQGDTSNETFYDDGEILFVFGVNNEYFAEMISLDKRKTAYKECPNSNDQLIPRNLTEMIYNIEPDRYHRFCKNSVTTPRNLAQDYWKNVGSVHKLPAQWPMFLNIINNPIDNTISYSWTDSINGLNRVTSFYTSSFTPNQGLNIYISGESLNEDFYIFSIDITYRHTIISYPPTINPTNEPTQIPTPTIKPTIKPTVFPSKFPTYSPTIIPSISPSTFPTMPPTNPSNNPTRNPFKIPSKNQSLIPTSTANPTTYEPTHDPIPKPSQMSQTTTYFNFTTTISIMNTIDSQPAIQVLYVENKHIFIQFDDITLPIALAVFIGVITLCSVVIVISRKIHTMYNEMNKSRALPDTDEIVITGHCINDGIDIISPLQSKSDPEQFIRIKSTDRVQLTTINEINETKSDSDIESIPSTTTTKTYEHNWSTIIASTSVNSFGLSSLNEAVHNATTSSQFDQAEQMLNKLEMKLTQQNINLSENKSYDMSSTDTSIYFTNESSVGSTANNVITQFNTIKNQNIQDF